MSQRTRVAVLTLGLTIAALTAFSLTSNHAGHLVNSVASAVWGS